MIGALPDTSSLLSYTMPDRMPEMAHYFFISTMVAHTSVLVAPQQNFIS
jgi:hypothetical protein